MTDPDEIRGGERPWDAIAIDPRDDVAVALRDIEGETRVHVGGEIRIVRVATRIPMGHKFAMRNLPAGEFILKYGQRIGVTTCPVLLGGHVHVHNLKSCRAS
jgi:hypothetical protein